MFLACGDALFDMFARAGGDEPGAITLDGRIGGSPLNVAMGLARLGLPTGYFTKISTDLFGQRIAAHLQREGIDISLCPRSAQNSTLAMVALNAEGVPNYAFYVNGTADTSLTEAELPPLPEAVRVVHLGSYSTATEPTASSLVKLVAREKARRFISYDPNVRLAIEPDRDVWRARIASLTPIAHLMKASDEDLELLYPGQSPEALMAQWIAAGVRLAVVTRGAKGAIAMAAGGAKAAVPGRKVEVVDTVGAGDTFQAGLIAGLSLADRLEPAKAAAISSQDLETLIDFAARAAAVTCSRRGADLPRKGEVDWPRFAG